MNPAAQAPCPRQQHPFSPFSLLGGLVLPRDRLPAFTLDWLHLKERFFPGLRTAAMDFLDLISVEVKGADLRKQIREGPRDPRRHALGFMDKFLGLLEGHGTRVLARVYVKPIGIAFNGRSVFTSAVQILAGEFQSFLAAKHGYGLMVLDSRNKPKNTSVAHSVFTQKFKTAGDAYDRLIEMPVFGHSDNHAGIQAADLICSAFLFPMATHAYCQGRVTNIHVHPEYFRIRDMFGVRLKRFQYRYQDASGWWHGGITVSDALGHQRGALLFGP